MGNVSVVAGELGVNRNTAFGWARKAGRSSVRLPRRHAGRDEYERLRAAGVALQSGDGQEGALLDRPGVQKQDRSGTGFLAVIWKLCGNRACDDGLTHHCLRDAPLWTSYAATSCRRSEVLGWRWSPIHWDECAIELGWVVVEEGNTYRLRKLTKDGDDNAIIYVDQALMNVLKWQKERQDAERERLGDLWMDHDLVFARDGFKLYRGEAGGPQDPEKVSARWRTARNRLHLPENFRLHDWRASKITNDLDNHENPVEVSANARHHSPGYTMARYGRRRAEGAKKLAASSASRIGLSSLV
ncbi:hypothetical protein ACFQ61_10960 [Streptomyces sp. NPDC056500]|uniref:hypothetical protein n=1 Tax=Streptomyces sp. NPDC056500 TaxID=3345840 RepID=UPI0036B45765